MVDLYSIKQIIYYFNHLLETNMDTQFRTEKNKNRANLHGVHSLDRFVFTVPDLAVARRFYDTFGMDMRDEDGRLDMYTFGHPHRWASIFQAPGPKKLQYLRFACFAEDFEAIRARARSMGVAEHAPHPLGNDEGFWITHTDGYPIQVVVNYKSSPETESVPVPSRKVEPGSGKAWNRKIAPRVRPRRLSHALMFSPDVLGAIKFFEDVLGLRLSDRSDDIVAFLHGVHGSDHHLVALAKSNGAGLHHASWDVGNIDEVGLGMEQMLAGGYTRGWGVGRHVLGSNYFYYARDPWGSHFEYSYDIDFVPGDFEWKSANNSPEDSFYVWGPAVPPDFVTNFELGDAGALPPEEAHKVAQAVASA
ncbi:MAG: Metapyrocatechase [Polaromonas sp.]|nr:Metapyrocatechase [Polaromonas sp.]